jgi:hypothetical protein
MTQSRANVRRMVSPMSDILPGTKTAAHLASVHRQPLPGCAVRRDRYRGLDVAAGRPEVFVIPGDNPLSLLGPILSSGAN